MEVFRWARMDLGTAVLMQCVFLKEINHIDLVSGRKKRRKTKEIKMG